MAFLPLCHIAERMGGEYMALYTGTRLNFVENPDTVPENVREIAPTVFTAVPRVWEKFYSGVTIALKESTRLQQAAALGEAEELGVGGVKALGRQRHVVLLCTGGMAVWKAGGGCQAWARGWARACVGSRARCARRSKARAQPGAASGSSARFLGRGPGSAHLQHAPHLLHLGRVHSRPVGRGLRVARRDGRAEVAARQQRRHCG